MLNTTVQSSVWCKVSNKTENKQRNRELKQRSRKRGFARRLKSRGNAWVYFHFARNCAKCSRRLTKGANAKLNVEQWIEQCLCRKNVNRNCCGGARCIARRSRWRYARELLTNSITISNECRKELRCESQFERTSRVRGERLIVRQSARSPTIKFLSNFLLLSLSVYPRVIVETRN